ncbi:MAG: hypothetical protein WBB67_09675 [bacterium]
MYNFLELDKITRKWMLEEFLNEQNSGQPYLSTQLTNSGKKVFLIEMQKAITSSSGNEITLGKAIMNPSCWRPSYIDKRGRTISINPQASAQRLAQTEFNTWYVRGLARRLIEEKVDLCEVYRAGSAEDPRTECTSWEGKTFKVQDIYNGHRARYWPLPGNPGAFSVPSGPNCHHSIKRIK